MKRNDKRILYLTHRLPYPAHGGDRVKALHLLKHLAEIGTIGMIALDESDHTSPEAIYELSRYANLKVVPFFRAKAGVRILRNLFTNVPIEYAYYNSP